MIRKFIGYYKPHRKLFFIDMLCAFIVALCDLFYPVIAKDIINEYVPSQNLRLLLVWAGVLLGIYALKALLNYIIQYWGHVVGVRMQGDMRRDMFRRLQKLPFSFYDENKTGAVMSRLINDLFDVSELAHHGPEDLFLSAIMLVGSFVMLATIDVWLTLIVFAFLPFIVLFAVKTRKEMNRAFKKAREEIAEINAGLETSISGVRVTRAYTAEDYENAGFDRANERFKHARGDAYRIMGVFHSGTSFFMDLLYLAVLVAGGLFFYYGRIDVGEFAAFLLYINMFLKPVNRIVAIFEQLQNGMTGFVRFLEIMDVPVETDAPGALEPERLEGAIRFEDVRFGYKSADGGDTQVIDGLSLSIEKGRTVALVGPSGGGKTTLCHLIPRFYELDAGRITIDGMDIRDMTRYALRKNIGIVAQDVFLFAGTIRDNIAYGRPDASDAEVEEAARCANIHDFILSLPNGYDTEVGERGVKLSGGQKQRISIARVFLKNPSILILDEATSALDSVTEVKIQHAFDELARGRTTLVIAHRLSTIRSADRILVVENGRIAEQGSHEVLLAQNGEYASLWCTQNGKA